MSNSATAPPRPTSTSSPARAPCWKPSAPAASVSTSPAAPTSPSQRGSRPARCRPLLRWRRLRRARRPRAFSKSILIEHLLRLPGMRPRIPVGFGDGYVEIEELKQAGGVAVGVATDEPECRDTSPWKRRNLIGVGADYIIPNFLCRQVLLPMLFPEHDPISTLRPLAPPGQAPRRAAPRSCTWTTGWRSTTPRRPSPIPTCAAVAARLAAAKSAGAARILMMGAHVLRAGVNRHIIDLVERGFLDHIAMNGAGAIHDYELARIGATTESVASLHPHRRVRPLARNRRAERLDPRSRRRCPSASAKTSAAASTSSDYPAPRSLRVRRRLACPRPRHRPRGHRLRHPARASQLRRRGPRRGQLPRLPDLRAHRASAWKAACCSASAPPSWARKSI